MEPQQTESAPANIQGLLAAETACRVQTPIRSLVVATEPAQATEMVAAILRPVALAAVQPAAADSPMAPRSAAQAVRSAAPTANKVTRAELMLARLDRAMPAMAVQVAPRRATTRAEWATQADTRMSRPADKVARSVTAIHRAGLPLARTVVVS